MPASKRRTGAKGDKMVNISLAYVAFLHDQLAVNQEKLRDILGSGAQVISGYSSDGLASALIKDSPYGEADRLTRMIKGWGMDLKQSRRGSTIQFEVRCPYAEYVHPRLSSENPICPLGEYALGEVRRTDRRASLESSALTEGGSRFAIKLSQIEHRPAKTPRRKKA